MNQKEILTFFQLSDTSELPEVLELELFELKKNILSKPLLYKPLQPKIKRLELLQPIVEEYLEILPFHLSDSMFTFRYVTNPLELWKAYMQDKNAWKRYFSLSESPAAMLELIHKGLEMEIHYSNQFPDLNWIDEQPLFGVDPDPMPIQKALLYADEQGWNTFKLLESHKSELPKPLLLGLKRLSLQIQFLKG